MAFPSSSDVPWLIPRFASAPESLDGTALVPAVSSEPTLAKARLATPVPTLLNARLVPIATPPAIGSTDPVSIPCCANLPPNSAIFPVLTVIQPFSTRTDLLVNLFAISLARSMAAASLIEPFWNLVFMSINSFWTEFLSTVRSATGLVTIPAAFFAIVPT